MQEVVTSSTASFHGQAVFTKLHLCHKTIIFGSGVVSQPAENPHQCRFAVAESRFDLPDPNATATTTTTRAGYFETL
jgi:hypothetical protein